MVLLMLNFAFLARKSLGGVQTVALEAWIKGIKVKSKCVYVLTKSVYDSVTP